MELHSYAKRRATPKKWSIEQKRKLVEARIAYDTLFVQKPRDSVLPWKKILSLTNLDEYNVFFVRKQWSNMVAKYKQYKQNRLGNIPTQAIDDEMIHKITQEWEFFAPIHVYMMRKTNNLHSYALQQEQPVPNIANSNSNSTHSSTECINVFSSDTNEEFGADRVATPSTVAVRIKSEFPAQNTDHDFYSKKWVEQQQQQQRLNYFADASEDTQESTVMMEIKTEHDDEPQNTTSINEVVIIGSQQQHETMSMPMDVQQQLSPDQHVAAPELPSAQKATCKLSERDRYYRHKRRFNRRLERRFDALLQVVGQVVKAEYPSIDVKPLMSVANAATDLGSNLLGRIFSSGDEFDDDSEEDTEIDANSRAKTNEQAKDSAATANENVQKSRWYITPR